jgi:hypothetical protein
MTSIEFFNATFIDVIRNLNNYFTEYSDTN